MWKNLVIQHAARPKRNMPHGALFRNFSSSSPKLLKKILVANRGEISCRIQRTAQRLGCRTVAVFSDADAQSQHALMADEAYHIGESAATKSYLDSEKILQIAKESGAEGIHPGYGFLSENANFAIDCAKNGIEFIGPPVDAIEAMGSKSASKDIMIAAGVPVTPGYHGEDQSIEKLKAEAEAMKYPVLIKAVLGGGGKGMRIVEKPEDLEEGVNACKREAISSFGDDCVLVEKYLRRPRHVELQIFGDKHGNVVHLFERDCSVQRRHQKVLEEAPAPFMTEELRKKMGDAAVAAAKAVGYVGAGTVEFMLDEDDSFYFMEMNTRLQVEHPVTELITKKDLVELQLLVASGGALPFKQEDLKIHGHSIEARVYAENPYNNFLPGTGSLKHMELPTASENVRVDTGVVAGDEVSIFYDPMIAKLIVHGPDRETALKRLVSSLKDFQIVGLPTNIEFLARTASHEEFQKGGVNTSFLDVYGEGLTTPLGDVPDHAALIGALSLLLREQIAANFKEANGAWTDSALSSFRSAGTSDRKFRLFDNEKSIDVCFEALDGRHGAYVATLNGEEKTIVSGDLEYDGSFEIRVGSNRYVGTVVFEDGNVTVFCSDGELRYNYQLEVPSSDFGGGSGGASGGSNKITSPMPGKVIKVLVNPGDVVEADQPLMIMEAMKMEHVIRAQSSGTVAEVLYKEDDFVGEGGQILIEMEDA